MPSYHHGDLRETLIGCALEMLEESGAGQLNLRALARRAGSEDTAAPYHHFRTRLELMAALAQRGFQQLGANLQDATLSLRELGRAYICFATRHPGLYGLMFCAELSNESDHSDLHAVGKSMLKTLVERVADSRPAALAALAAWHGVASFAAQGVLHGQNHLPPGPELAEIVSDQVAHWVEFDT